MALTCNGSGEITLQEIVNAINSNITTIDDLALNDLSNVEATTPVDGDIIYFDIALQKWVAGQPASTQIPSDWDQTDSTKKDYIKNKPNVDDYEKDLGSPATAGQILSSDISGNRSWVDNISSVNLSTEYINDKVIIKNDSGDNATILSATVVASG